MKLEFAHDREVAIAIISAIGQCYEQAPTEGFDEMRMQQMKSIKKLAAVTLLFGSVGLPISSSASLAQVTEIDVHSAQSAIMSAGSTAREVSRIGNVESVGVINVGFRTTPRFRDNNIPDRSEFEISVQKNWAGIKRLRTALKSNSATRSALAEHGVSVGEVVGADVSSNGSLRIYILR